MCTMRANSPLTWEQVKMCTRGLFHGEQSMKA
jgi:hypothetical protein